MNCADNALGSPGRAGQVQAASFRVRVKALIQHRDTCFQLTFQSIKALTFLLEPDV